VHTGPNQNLAREEKKKEKERERKRKEREEKERERERKRKHRAKLDEMERSIFTFGACLRTRIITYLPNNE